MSDTSDGRQDFHVTGHIWWSRYLDISVHDAHTGRTFRVQFTQATDGKLKRSGGGAYGPGEEERFELAQEEAEEWVTEEFGYEVLGKQTWSRTNTLRGTSFSERQALAALSGDELSELCSRLRHGEIDLGDEEADADE